MADKLAEQIIAEYKREVGSSICANFRNLCQDTADHIYPYAQINSEYTPGSERTTRIFDVTPMQDAKKMAAGFKHVLIPAGQTFFEIRVSSRFNQNENVQRYLSYLTEATHEKIFASNFMTMIDDVIKAWIIFGPSCLFQEWTRKKGLNYKYCPVGSYTIIEDDSCNVIGSMHRYKMTAVNAYKKYGDRAGKEVLKAIEKPETQFKEFWYILKSAPRDINPRISTQANINMPIGVWVVNESEKSMVEIGGFPEKKYIIGRWERPEFEKYGRGVGTEILPQVKILFEMAQLHLECGNKWINPPRQALVDAIEGEIRVAPNAINWVGQIDAIRALDSALSGNFPISKDELEAQRQIIHEAFYRNAFDPLEQLTGDRRTTLEIQERIRGTLKHLGPPAGRIWQEQLSPCLEASILDLIRNRQVVPPPPELQGTGFGIEYVGPLALTIKGEQARGFQEFALQVGQLSALFPDEHLSDHIDFDESIPRMGRTLGVNIEDISTIEQREIKREKRQQMQQQMLAMQMAQAAGKAYKDGSKEPEPNSPASQLMEG